MQMCARCMRPWCMYQWCSYPWYMYMYMFSTRKRCLIGILIWGYQNFYSLPPKNWILGPKTAKFGPKLAFWAKYRHFWPIWFNAWPKSNADKLPRCFFPLCGYQNTFTDSCHLFQFHEKVLVNTISKESTFTRICDDCQRLSQFNGMVNIFAMLSDHMFTRRS